jgi:hypothetical protein
MADYHACPGCGRRAQKAMSSNWFPVYKCSKCSTYYCKECNRDKCPKCEASGRNETGKVYA